MSRSFRTEATATDSFVRASSHRQRNWSIPNNSTTYIGTCYNSCSRRRFGGKKFSRTAYKGSFSVQVNSEPLHRRWLRVCLHNSKLFAFARTKQEMSPLTVKCLIFGVHIKMIARTVHSQAESIPLIQSAISSVFLRPKSNQQNQPQGTNQNCRNQGKQLLGVDSVSQQPVPPLLDCRDNRTS